MILVPDLAQQMNNRISTKEDSEDSDDSEIRVEKSKNVLRSNAGRLGPLKTFKIHQHDGSEEELNGEQVYKYLQEYMRPLYSAPLGYIDMTFGKHNTHKRKCMVDGGSMLNLVSAREAKSLGWDNQVDIRMTLNGVNDEGSLLVGIAENIFCQIGTVYGYQHWWVCETDVPMILGRPFLLDFEAKVDYSEEFGERITVLDSRGLGIRIPTGDPKDPQLTREIPQMDWRVPYSTPQSDRRHRTMKASKVEVEGKNGSSQSFL